MFTKTLTIENFKAIGSPVRIELKPITLLFGANSSGKSTIIQALKYAKEIIDHEDERAHVQPTMQHHRHTETFRDFRRFVHQHDVSRVIRFTFELDVSDDHIIEGAYREDRPTFREIGERIQSASVAIEVRYFAEVGMAFATGYEVHYNGELFTRIEYLTEPFWGVVITKFANRHALFLASPDSALKTEPENVNLLADVDEACSTIFDFSWYCPTNTLDLILKRPSEKVSPFAEMKSALPGSWFHERLKEAVKNEAQRRSLPEPDDNVLSLLSALIQSPLDCVKGELDPLIHIGPIRSIPDLTYRPLETPDESRWFSGLGAWDRLHQYAPEHLRKLNFWLSKRLKAGYQLELKQFLELPQGLDIGELSKTDLQNLRSYSRLVLIDEQTGMSLDPQDVGTGLSQVIPVIDAVLRNCGTGFPIAIEQPELHLHPSQQVELTDLFISMIAQDSGARLIETHSEHILLRLLRRIRETHEGELPPDEDGLHSQELSLTPEDVAIHYIERDDVQGFLKVRKLEIGEDGDSEGDWPNGFFEERRRELF